MEGWPKVIGETDDMTTIEHAAGEALSGLRRSSAATITAAYLGNHNVAPDQITAILASIHAALGALTAPAEPAAAKLIPVVSIRKSLQPDAITCLDCGWKGQMLKRHLTASHGLTPEQYRERWSLQPDYPVVAPNYAQKRSALAKEIGLGLGLGTGPRRRPVR
jgi:predicted transcriptional regulator